MAITYTPAELLRTAKWAIRGLGRYLRWEIRTGTANLSLLVYYRDKRTGEEKIHNVAI